jgi:PilZ domain
MVSVTYRSYKHFNFPGIEYARTSALVPTGGRLEIQIDKKGERSDPAQRRGSPRIRLQVPVFLRGVDTSGVEFIELTKTLNISATGACIASTHFLRPDQVVSITVPAPSPTSSSSVVPNETPPISAKILRHWITGDIRLFGVEFLRPLE